MKELSAGKLVEKKSRFYAHLYQIDSPDEMTSILKIHRTIYKKANHHCYAVHIKEQQSVIDRFSDDGEIGHPGKILLELLTQNGLNKNAIVISRVFGGIKLGSGGVSRAFRSAGNAVIEYMKSK